MALTVPSFQQAALVVARSDRVATLPERAALLSGVPPIPMTLVWHPRTTTSDRHRFIRDALKAVVGRQERSTRPALEKIVGSGAPE